MRTIKELVKEVQLAPMNTGIEVIVKILRKLGWKLFY
jgi:hypothetical protein